MDSPFNRSAVTRRSPPPLADNLQTSQFTSDAHNESELVPTSEIQKWMTSIEQCLDEVCDITADGGKLNTDQKLRINGLCRKVLSASSQMAVQYQSLKQEALQGHQTIKTLSEKCDLAECLGEIKKTIQETNRPAAQTMSFTDVIKSGQKTLLGQLLPIPLRSIQMTKDQVTKQRT